MGKTDKIILTPEQEQWLIRHFKHTKNDEIMSRLSLTHSALHRFARELGLKKSPQFMKKCQTTATQAAWAANRRKGWPPKGYIIPRSWECRFQKGVTNIERLGPKKEAERVRKAAESRRATVKKERIRIHWGFEQRTKLKLYGSRKKRQYRYELRQRGYQVERGGSDAYVTAETQRSPIVETNARKYGIRVIEDR